ncbi:MAG: peptidoglycan DD-metalloendopeptidase family protein [Gammaproteobacteria bacterium]|nr:peptidoglycan DD-metalloendopeptidase family protein [Gammaproteobacteria bacterium]
MKPVLVTMLVAVLLAGCVTVKPTTSLQRGPGWYTVKRSDTLYSIAWRYGLDYQQLAAWNGIDVNAPIHPGQRLRLIRPSAGTTASSPAAKTTTRSSAPQRDKPATSGKSTTSAPAPVVSYSGNDPRSWLWPTDGRLLSTFLAADLARRGIRITGKAGQPVRAVADGKVVYSGNGLAGYGNLIIIKHSDTFLSAYAYCQERLVQEGKRVKAGSKVATMGSRDDRAQLHFEIRRNGKPVDPLKYLPKR